MTANPFETAINAAIELGVASIDAHRASSIARAAGDQPTRFYHNGEHFAFLAQGGNEVQEMLVSYGIEDDTAKLLANASTIAGRDHDVVYINADQCILPEVQSFLSSFIDEKNGVYTIVNDKKIDALTQPEKENLAIALHAFGFRPGETLHPFHGQNEFLSALYSLQANSGLNSAAKIMVAGIIQATIPFDQPNSIEVMIDRAREYGGLTQAETHALGLAAAHMANRDVAGFGSTPEHFQAQTRQLMRESGTRLTNPEAIDAACGQLIGFFESLIQQKDSKPVFRSYHFTADDGQILCHPPARELTEKNEYATRQIASSIGKLKAMQLAAKRALATGDTELPGSADGEEIVKRAAKIEELHSERIHQRQK